MTRIAIIDPQFDRDPDIEAAEAGTGVEFQILRPGAGSVDPDLVRGADAVVNCRSRHLLTAPIVEGMERVRIVVQAGVGFNHIDLDACARRGIPVCNTPDYGTMEVADHAMGLALALLRGIPTYNERLLTRDDAWSTQSLPVPPIRRIAGLTFGVVGLGRIGTAVALRARAFQMSVAFYDPYLPPGQELAFGFERATALAALLERADLVSLHCPMTEQTRSMINAETIARMKPGAILINTARGGMIDLDAVETGLQTGQLSGVALDVLPHEPLNRRHPLLTAWTAREAWLEGRLLITPHAAFYTPESLVDMRRLSIRAVMSFLRDGKLRSCVNLRELSSHGFKFDT
jgi:lactate dehydrogenase-like 2-hydroxyacid dehydrogenase